VSLLLFKTKCHSSIDFIHNCYCTSCSA